jgi:hypothetical protein
MVKQGKKANFKIIKSNNNIINIKNTFILSKESANKIKQLIKEKKPNYDLTSSEIIVPSSKFRRLKNNQLNSKFQFLSKNKQKELFFKICSDFHKIRKLFRILVEHSKFLYYPKEDKDFPNLYEIEKKIENYYFFNLDEFIKEVNDIFDFYFGYYAGSPTNYKSVKEINDFFDEKVEEIKKEKIVVKDDFISEVKKNKLTKLLYELSDEDLIRLISKYEKFFDNKMSGLKKVFTLKNEKLSYLDYRNIKNSIYLLNPKLKDKQE